MNMIMILLITITIPMSVMLLSSTSHAHGFVESPFSRGFRYSMRRGTGDFSMVGTAAWEPENLAWFKGFPTAENSPRDGQLASANCMRGCPQIDRQSKTLWDKTTLSSGPNTFTWRYMTPHRTAKWEYFMTKPNWNPDAPLTRAQFDLIPIATFEGQNQRIEPNSQTHHTVHIPFDRQGYHIIYAVWTTLDTPMAFYNIIDLDITKPEPTTTLYPLNLQIIDKTSASISLTWQPAIKNFPTIAYYHIFREGVKIAEVAGHTLSYVDQGLMPGTTHTYQVQAHVISEPSNIATGTTLATVMTPTPDFTYHISGMGTTRQHLTLTNHTQTNLPIGWELQLNFTGGNPYLEWPATWVRGAHGHANTTVNVPLHANTSITIPMGVSTNTSILNLSINNKAATNESDILN